MFHFTSVFGAAQALYKRGVFVICHMVPLAFLSRRVIHTSLTGCRRVMCKIYDSCVKRSWNRSLGSYLDCRPSNYGSSIVDKTICIGLHTYFVAIRQLSPRVWSCSRCFPVIGASISCGSCAYSGVPSPF